LFAYALAKIRVLREETLRMDAVPREIAYVCGVILYFQQECYQNIGGQGASSMQDLEVGLERLAHGAFMVLAGDRAD
jgi:hypothetical protein